MRCSRRSRRRSPAKRQSICRANNNPKPLRGDVPILIGGSGERKTLRLVAEYADGCNLFGDPSGSSTCSASCKATARSLGRDPAEITKIIDEDDRDRRDGGGGSGEARCDACRGAARAADCRHVAGTPDKILENAQAFRDVGIEGLTFSMPDVHDLEAVALAGETLAPLFNADRQPAA